MKYTVTFRPLLTESHFDRKRKHITVPVRVLPGDLPTSINVFESPSMERTLFRLRYASSEPDISHIDVDGTTIYYGTRTGRVYAIVTNEGSEEVLALISKHIHPLQELARKTSDRNRKENNWRLFEDLYSTVLP